MEDDILAISTGLPTEDETSETTVQDVFGLLPYFHDYNCKIVSFFVKLLN